MPGESKPETVREFLTTIRDHYATVTLYNTLFKPNVSLPHYMSFLSKLLAIEPQATPGEMKVVVRRENAYWRIVGEGYDCHSDEQLEWGDHWDVEYRPAAEVLGMELDDRSEASRMEVTAWLLEELGVYLDDPRT